MTSPAGSSALVAANTYYEGKFLGKAFDGPTAFVGDMFCEDINTDAKYLSMSVTQGDPPLRPWYGPKHIKMLRQLAESIKLIPYEKTFALDANDVKFDRTGSIMAAIDRSFANMNYDREVLIFAALMGNTALGADGVPFFSNSHPFANGSGDNLTTDDLGFAAWKNANAAMRTFQTEDGKKLDYVPNVLLCSVELEPKALELLGPHRPIAVNSSGAFDAVSSVVGMSTIPNVYAGRFTVVSTPQLVGAQWGAFCLNRGMKPVVRGIGTELHPVILDKESDHTRFFSNQLVYSAEGFFGFGPGQWQCGYGRTSS